METNTKFTQGEWNVSKHGNNDSFGIHVVGNDFAIIKGGNEEGGEAEANAKLIAAAPDMLSVLKEAVDHAHVYDTNKNLVELFQAVINKALN